MTIVRHIVKLKASIACLVMTGMCFIINGCATAYIPVALPIPGEFNLSGVSKIALIDFNTISDPLCAFATDHETTKIVQDMVSSVLSESKLLSVARLDTEHFIAEQAMSRPDKRFDAILYGQVWWELTPESINTYPVVYTLDSWDNITYKKQTILGEIDAVAKVMRERKQELAIHFSRSLNASLMLSLTLYRIGSNGEVTKIVDTFAVENQTFMMNNGEMNIRFTKISDESSRRAAILKKTTETDSLWGQLKSVTAIEHQKQDFSGRTQLSKKTITLPTELQTKIVLADRLASNLVEKITPSAITINIKCDFSDKKLFNLLKEGAYSSAKEYVSYALHQKYDKEICRRFIPLADLPVPQVYLTNDVKIKSKNEDFTDIVKKSKEYFFALGLCAEASGDYDEALDTYRFAFKHAPEKELALGISRCLFALDMNKRVAEKVRAVKASAVKSDLK